MDDEGVVGEEGDVRPMEPPTAAVAVAGVIEALVPAIRLRRWLENGTHGGVRSE